MSTAAWRQARTRGSRTAFAPRAPDRSRTHRRDVGMSYPPPVLAIRRIGGGVTGFSQVGVWGTAGVTVGRRSWCERVTKVGEGSLTLRDISGRNGRCALG